MYTWLPIVISGIASGAALLSLLQTQRSNRLAQHAHRVAQRALSEAVEANRIAIDANQLSEDANAISQRALNISREDFDYRWGLNVEDSGIVTITHDSAADAHDLMVLIHAQHEGEPVPAAEISQQVTPRSTSGNHITFDIKRLFPQLITKTLSESVIEFSGFDGFAVARGRNRVTATIVIALSWTTPGGRHCGSVFKESLAIREDRTGDVVYKLLPSADTQLRNVN